MLVYIYMKKECIKRSFKKYIFVVSWDIANDRFPSSTYSQVRYINNFFKIPPLINKKFRYPVYIAGLGFEIIES